ncbi:MAG: acetylxylan esterase [Acidobacteriota bacterium]|nr:acetylxylan esterase [Acidobacteriota bacterium]
MMRRTLALAVLLATVPSLAHAQMPAGYDPDESHIQPYTLLDPLTFSDGSRVNTAADWPRRRTELLRLFEQNVYGRTPEAAKHIPLRFHVDEADTPALGGKALRRQITVYFSARREDGPKEHLLLYLPANAHGPIPVVIGLNFFGNQTVLADPGIRLNPVWARAQHTTGPAHLETPAESTRGMQTQEWQVEKVLARGYAFATIYCGDIDPDFTDSIQLGVRPLFYAPGQTAPAAEDWGALGTWAWGLSRAVDYLQTDRHVAPHRIAVTGHSRLGKAADWAAAQDPRFAIILSTESGKAGQSLYRRRYGEDIRHLEHSFPHWFCQNYAKWVGRETEIPVDGNLMLSLLAPRPVYVASAKDDLWSDPRGEFLSAVDASRVYRLLGHQGLVTTEFPPVDHPVDTPVQHDVAYHIRTGKHDVTAYDWDQYLSFLDLHWGRRQ